jgi:hypothetical protein
MKFGTNIVPEGSHSTFMFLAMSEGNKEASMSSRES